MEINAPKGSMDEEIIIILDSYKVKLPASSSDRETYLAGFKTLIAYMFPTYLTFDATNVKLNDIKMLVTDFKLQVQHAASKNDAFSFRFVRCHPLLQGSRQRFIYPIATVLMFEYHKSHGNYLWSGYNNFVMRTMTIDILGAINITEYFEEIYHLGGRTYTNTAKDELEYIQNGYIHIYVGVRDVVMNEEHIEHVLAQLFPMVLKNLNAFCVLKKLSLDFLQ
ncbi:hypothetical protein ACE6H2_006023 [Prunus campanulata]